MTTDMFVFHNHNAVVSSFMTFQRVWNKRTTGITNGAGTAHPSRELEAINGLTVKL
jgi:hypothetical protein